MIHPHPIPIIIHTRRTPDVLPPHVEQPSPFAELRSLGYVPTRRSRRSRDLRSRRICQIVPAIRLIYHRLGFVPHEVQRDLALWRGVAKSRGAVGNVGVFPAFLERAQSVHQADGAGPGGGQPVRLGRSGGREEGRGEEEVLVRVQAGEVVGPDGADEVDEVLWGAEEEFVAVVEHVAGFGEEEAPGAEGDEEVCGRGF